MILNSYSNKNKGFTLMEAIVAISIIVIGVIGSFNLITFAISASSLSSHRLIAAHLAQEGIEIVRNIRDTNWLEQQVNPANSWNEGLTGCGCSCDNMHLEEGCVVDYKTPTTEEPTLSLFSDDGVHNYLNIDSDGFYSYSPGTQTKFRRKIVIFNTNPDILEVCARVEWEEKGRPHTVIVKENLYNWLQ